jgi:methylmalonyl-CoA/ethylmalonyl-CoA epimerase
VAPSAYSLPIAAVFDHTAVAAPRIRDLLPIYLDLLGGTFVQGGDNPRVGYRALQLEYQSGGRIELMEPLLGSSFFDSFFARKGSGLHHITF